MPRSQARKAPGLPLCSKSGSCRQQDDQDALGQVVAVGRLQAGRRQPTPSKGRVERRRAGPRRRRGDDRACSSRLADVFGEEVGMTRLGRSGMEGDPSC